MKINEIKEFSETSFRAVSELLPQLAPGSDPITRERFIEVIQSDSSHLFLAEHEGRIIGMVTVVSYSVPTAQRFWIEDVVVDESFRGQGFGRVILNFATEYCRLNGAMTIDLTSRPFRVAANQLYKQSGFVIRETNVYRYIFQ